MTDDSATLPLGEADPQLVPETGVTGQPSDPADIGQRAEAGAAEAPAWNPTASGTSSDGFTGTSFGLRDPAAGNGPPWARLIATDSSYQPPRLIRWPIVVGALLFAVWIAGTAVPFSTSSTGSNRSSPYELTAADAQFTATFPSQPQRIQKDIGSATALIYLSDLADHAVGVTYVQVPASTTFDLDGAVTGAATAEKGGRVISRNRVTFLGQPAEDAVISFSGGVGNVRVVAIGAAAYVMEGYGSSAASYRRDYTTLLSTFTTTATPVAPESPTPTSAPGPSPASLPDSGVGTLGSKVIPAPSGFELTQDADPPNGPLSAAGFNSFVNAPNAATDLHYVAGYTVTYDDNQTGDSLSVALFEFQNPTDARAFASGFAQESGVKSGNDPTIPGAQTYDSLSADSSGAYQHGTVASKGSTVAVANYASGSATRPALLDAVAGQQYGRM